MIQWIEIKNFKGLAELKIDLVDYNKESKHDPTSHSVEHKGQQIMSSLGILGANATGKTTFIESLGVFTKIIKDVFSTDIIKSLDLIISENLDDSLENISIPVHSIVEEISPSNWTKKIASKYYEDYSGSGVQPIKISLSTNDDVLNLTIDKENILLFDNNDNKLDLSSIVREVHSLSVTDGDSKPIENMNFFKSKRGRVPNFYGKSPAFSFLLNNKKVNNNLTENQKKASLFTRRIGTIFKYDSRREYRINQPPGIGVYTGKHSSIFAGNVYRFIKDETRKKYLEELMGIIDLDVKSMTVAAKNNKLDVNIVSRSTNIHHTIDDLSTGTKKMIDILMSYIDNKPKLILIDEIENGLQPRLIKFIIDLFTHPQNNNRSQLFFTTHKPQIIDKYLSSNNMIISIKNEEGINRWIKASDLDFDKNFRLPEVYLSGVNSKNKLTLGIDEMFELEDILDELKSR